MTPTFRTLAGTGAVLAAFATSALATDAINIRIQNTATSGQLPMAIAVTPLPGDGNPMSGVGGSCPTTYVAPAQSDAVVCTLTTNVEIFTLRSGFTITFGSLAGQPSWSAPYWVDDPALGDVWAWPANVPLPPNEQFARQTQAGNLQAEAPFSAASFSKPASSQYELVLTLPAAPVSVQGRAAQVDGARNVMARIACHGSVACRLGTVSVTAPLPRAGARGNGLGASAPTHSLVATGGPVTIPAGRTAAVRLRMSRRAFAAFDRAGTVRTSGRVVTVPAAGPGGTSVRHPVVLLFR